MRNEILHFGRAASFSGREKRLVGFAELNPEQRAEYRRQSVEDLRHLQQENIAKVRSVGESLDPDARTPKFKENPAERARALEAARRAGADVVQKYEWRGHARYRPVSPDGRPIQYRYDNTGLHERFKENDGSWTRGRTLRSYIDIRAEGDRRAAEREREAAMAESRKLRGLIMQREMHITHLNHRSFRRYQLMRDLGIKPIPSLELPRYQYIDSSGSSTRLGVPSQEAQNTEPPLSKRERLEHYERQLSNGPSNSSARRFRAARKGRASETPVSQTSNITRSANVNTLRDGPYADAISEFRENDMRYFERATDAQNDTIKKLQAKGIEADLRGYDKFGNGIVAERLSDAALGVHLLPRQGGALNLGIWNEDELKIAAREGTLLKTVDMAALAKKGFDIDALASKNTAKEIGPALTKNLVSAVDRLRKNPMNDKQRVSAGKLVTALAPFFDELKVFADGIVKDGPESESVKTALKDLNAGLKKQYGTNSARMKNLLRFGNSIPAIKDPTTDALFALKIDAQSGFVFRQISPGEKKVVWNPERLAKLFTSFVDEKAIFEENERLDQAERRI